MQEIFKKIQDFPDYEVSNLGRVFSKKTSKIMSTQKNKNGYLLVSILNIFGFRKNVRVHRIVANCFIYKDNLRKYVNHKNGIKTDNRAENLEWCTASENMKHAYANNLADIKRGEKNCFCKLKETQVIEIKKLLQKGKAVKELSNIYGVSLQAIRDIKNKRRWRYLTVSKNLENGDCR